MQGAEKAEQERAVKKLGQQEPTKLRQSTTVLFVNGSMVLPHCLHVDEQQDELVASKTPRAHVGSAGLVYFCSLYTAQLSVVAKGEHVPQHSFFR